MEPPSFLRLSSIPPHEWNLLPHCLSLDTWGVSSFGCCEHGWAGDSRTLPSALLGINLEVGLPDPRIILFSNFPETAKPGLFFFFFFVPPALVGRVTLMGHCRRVSWPWRPLSLPGGGPLLFGSRSGSNPNPPEPWARCLLLLTSSASGLFLPVILSHSLLSHGFLCPEYLPSQPSWLNLSPV